MNFLGFRHGLFVFAFLFSVNSCAAPTEWQDKSDKPNTTAAILSHDLNQLQQKIQELTTNVETLEVQIDKLKQGMQSQHAMVSASDERLKKVEDAFAAVNQENKRKNIRILLARSSVLLEEARHQEVSDLLKPVMTQLDPESEGHDLLLLNLAKGMFGLKTYEEAALIAADVEVFHKESALVPAAILLQGNSFKAMKKQEEAKVFFQDLVKRFPDSPEAKEAKKILTPKKKTKKKKK